MNPDQRIRICITGSETFCAYYCHLVIRPARTPTLYMPLSKMLQFGRPGLERAGKETIEKVEKARVADCLREFA